MQFESHAEARAYLKQEASNIPSLRGKLKVVRDTSTRWCRKSGEPSKVEVWTVVMH